MQGEDYTICDDLILVTKYHKKHRNEIGITTKTEAYIQSLALKKGAFPSNEDEIFKDGHKDSLVSKIVQSSEKDKPADIQK
jgi:hypothetical protein